MPHRPAHASCKAGGSCIISLTSPASCLHRSSAAQSCTASSCVQCAACVASLHWPAWGTVARYTWRTAAHTLHRCARDTAARDTHRCTHDGRAATAGVQSSCRSGSAGGEAVERAGRHDDPRRCRRHRPAADRPAKVSARRTKQRVESPTGVRRNGRDGCRRARRTCGLCVRPIG